MKLSIRPRHPYQLSKSLPAFVLTFFLLLAAPSPCRGESLWDGIHAEWDAVQEGNSELYLPLETWHNRATYTHQQIAGFNENPWGLGYGKGIQDAQHNWRSFFILEFQDSHNQTEWMTGYAHTWNLASTGDWNWAGGYAAVVSLRQDVNDYRSPVPGVVPLLSVGLGQFSVLLTYIPLLLGSHGDVAFVIGRVTL